MNKYYFFSSTQANLTALQNDINADRIIGGTAAPNVQLYAIPDRLIQITVNTPTGTQDIFDVKSFSVCAEVADPAPQGLEIPTTDIKTLEEFQALDKVQICDFNDNP